MRVAEHVEADGRDAGADACGVEDAPPIVRLVNPPAVPGREDECLRAWLAVPEPVRLEIAREPGRDRHGARAPLALGLLLTVEETVAAPDADDRVAVELEVTPTDRLELGDPQPRFGEEADEEPILRRGERGKQSRSSSTER